jgi:membrane-associated phospholipid phosphatase
VRKPPWKKTEPERRIDWLIARIRTSRAPARKPGVMGALGAADQAVLRFLRTQAPHGPAAEGVGKGLGMVGEWAAIWVAIGVAGAATDPEKRQRWLIGAATGPGAVIANYALKVTFGRERPLIEDHPPLARAPSKLSFPSAHSTSSMAAATAFGRVDPRTRVPLYVLATSICISRPYLGMHYPSDVLAGACLGLFIGGFVPGVGERTLEERMAEFVATQAPDPAATVGSAPGAATVGSDPRNTDESASREVEGSDPALGDTETDSA